MLGQEALQLLDDLIMDMKDYLSGYRDTIKRNYSRLETYEYKIRADELYKWLKIFQTIREEQSQ